MKYYIEYEKLRDWKPEPFILTETTRQKAVRPPKPQKQRIVKHRLVFPLSVLTYEALLQMCLAQKVILKTNG